MKILLGVLALAVFPVWAQDLSALSQTEDHQDPPTEQICFSASQVERGIQQMEITKDHHKATALMLTQPLRSETVDCSSNMFAYPFLREADRNKPTTEGMWFNGETADLALQLNWEKTTLRNAQLYDVLVWRDNGEISQIASINQIVKVDEQRLMVDTNVKPNSTPVVRYSFEAPGDIPLNAEVWRRIRK